MAALALLSAFACAGCSLIWRPDDIAPADAVKTAEQAIKLAMDHCARSPADPDPDHWDAHLEHDIWIVHWEHDRKGISARIEKSDGTFEQCDFSGAAD